MWKILGLTLIGALALLLSLAAAKPDRFAVERSAVVQAAPDRLYPLIADLREFNRWNPFARKDPQIRLSYDGPASGPGAGYDFEGNGNVGKGRLSIREATPPRRVAMQLDMHSPMAGHNEIVFTLEPQGSATRVRWAMSGEAHFLGKLMDTVFGMERMIGGDFEAGLASLKALAEKR